jgi:hypothetical protein
LWLFGCEADGVLVVMVRRNELPICSALGPFWRGAPVRDLGLRASSSFIMYQRTLRFNTNIRSDLPPKVSCLGNLDGSRCTIGHLHTLCATIATQHPRDW